MATPNPNTTTTVVNQTQLPSWYQDFLTNLMGGAQNVAATPYEAYQGPRIADMTPEQLQAYQTVNSIQGAQTGRLMDASNLDMQAAGGNTSGAVQSYLNAAQGAGQDQFGQAGGLFNQSADANTAGVSQPYVQQGTQLATLGGLGNSQSAAQPYLSAASTSFPQAASAYMSPYTSGVVDQIAQLGARNLQENILPGISDKFIQAGTYGGSNNRDLVGRAIRDTGNNVLQQQTQALESGYNTAGQLYNQDASRYAGLAGTVGGLSSADLSRMLSSGQTIGQLGLGQSSATAADAARQIQAGQGLSNIGQANQQQTMNLANLTSANQLADYQRMLQASGQLASTAQEAQNLSLEGAAAQEASGQAIQGLQQKSLDTAYRDFLNQRNYPMQQMDFLSSIIHGLPVNTSSYQTETGPATQNQLQPSTLGQIAGLGAGVAGLSKLGFARGGAVQFKRLPMSRVRQPGHLVNGGTLGSMKAAA